MKRVAFFINGFNLYHSMMEDQRFRKYRWLDLRKLCSSHVHPTKQTLAGVYYFTAIAEWNPGKAKRHKTYIHALENSGVTVVKGEFRRVRKKLRLNRGGPQDVRMELSYWTFEEKQTDVNMALWIYQLAVEEEYDEAAIVSADSDLVPAVNGVRRKPFNKDVRIVLPPNQKAKELVQVSSSPRTKLREHDFRSCQFPLSIALPQSRTIDCPQEWR